MENQDAMSVKTPTQLNDPMENEPPNTNWIETLFNVTVNTPIDIDELPEVNEIFANFFQETTKVNPQFVQMLREGEVSTVQNVSWNILEKKDIVEP